MNDPFITRKELADAVKVSDDTVRNHEQDWGIRDARDKYCERPIRYRRSHPAVKKLLEDVA